MSYIILMELVDVRVWLAKRAIRKGHARSLRDPRVAKPLGDGLFEILKERYLTSDFRDPQTGDAINAIGIRETDGKLIGSTRESDIFGHSEFKPVWSK